MFVSIFFITTTEQMSLKSGTGVSTTEIFMGI